MFPGGTEMLVILLVIILLFGASRIPKVMKGLGEGMKAFKEGLEGRESTDQVTDTTALEGQIKGGIGRLAEYEDGVLRLGVPEGKKIVSVEMGLVTLEGNGSVETVQLSSVKKVVEFKS